MKMTSPTLEQILTEAQALSALDKIRLIERLSAGLGHDIEALSTNDAEAAHQRAWQEAVRSTAGALNDDPIERFPQGEYEERDTID